MPAHLAGLHVTVQAVVADVGLCACAPLVVDGALVHVEVGLDEGGSPFLVPVEFRGDILPKAFGVLQRSVWNELPVSRYVVS